MSSQAPAYARTNAPIVAGPVLCFIAKKFGMDLSVEEALILVPLVSSAYYTLGRMLEAWKPKLGYVLGVPKQPAYSDQPAPAPGPGEEVVAVVVDDTGEEGDAEPEMR